MFVPKNEVGVIVAFAEKAHQHGFQIKSIGAAFPDATIEKGGVLYRAEFEFMASAFDLHEHDHRKCDLIICWENDHGNGILPTLALAEEGWMDTDLSLPTDSRRSAYYWQRRALKAERALNAIKNKNEKDALETAEHLTCDQCERIFTWPGHYANRANAQRALNAHQRKHKRKESKA